MSFTVDGVTFVPDYKAKEKRLYQIIASRDDEIKFLRANGDLKDADSECLRLEIVALRDELRALRAKERRRAVKRKKGREQPVD